MKPKIGIGLLWVVWTVMLGCEKVPEFPITPSIKLNDLYFLDSFDASESDTLVVELRFQDGDGDLGLDGLDNAKPYHSSNFFVANQNGDMVPLSTYSAIGSDNTSFPLIFEFPGLDDVYDPESSIQGKLATDKTRDIPGFEFLPKNEFPYSCINYQLIDKIYLWGNSQWIDDTYNITDTLTQYEPDVYEISDTFFYTEKNPGSENISVEFFYKNSSGVFVPFDWVTDVRPPECSFPFDSRFPVLGLKEGGSPLEGVLRFYMIGLSFEPLFGNSTLQLVIKIKDRKLHESNAVTTGEFTLNSIKRN